MNIYELKVLAGFLVTESSISKIAKLQIINFLEEATEPEVKVFLLDGEIKFLDQQGEEVVNDRFAVSEAGGRIAKLRKSYNTYWGAFGGGPVWLAYRKIRAAFDACTERCGKYELNTARRQHCMIRCKAEVTKKEKHLKTLEKSKRSFTKRGAEVPEKG